MDIKTIVVELGADPGLERRLQAAAVLATASAGHVVGVTATGFSPEPFRGAGKEAGRYVAQARVRLQEQARDAETVFRDTLHRLTPDVPATHRFVEEEVGWAMVQESLVADIAIPAHPADATPVPAPMARTAEYVLLNSGRPVLILPPGTRLKPSGHVAIAWDGRREAARAVADAMPLLAVARYVSVITICRDRANVPDNGATGLLAWLERHGIKAALRMERGGDVGEILLGLASALQVDLLVAGGYGHSRARELVMGGTTRLLLTASPVPLLLSH